MIFSAIPAAQGLYDPTTERDACGVAMVADIQRPPLPRDRRPTALAALANLEHRGAAGAEPTSGDGAGILLQLPDELLRGRRRLRPARARRSTARTPTPPGIAFLPADADQRARAVALVERIADEEGLEVLGWRDVPVDAGRAPTSARPRAR